MTAEALPTVEKLLAIDALEPHTHTHKHNHAHRDGEEEKCKDRLPRI